MEKNKLYIGNLGYDVEEAQLWELFSAAGSVMQVTIIKDRESGQSKGFGFVEMNTPEEAETAIVKFNGEEHFGRKLTVNIALPKKDE